MVCVWVDSTDVTGSKGLLGASSAALLEELDPAQLNAGLRKLAAEMETILAGVTTGGSYSLDQIQVGVEINGEAGFNIVGTAKAGGKAAITLTFAKKPQ